MRRLAHLLLILVLTAPFSACAQDDCQFGSAEAADGLTRALEKAPSCSAAVAAFNACRWGSSADAQFAPIVITKCEKSFFPRLSPSGKTHYGGEMQMCAYEYARQQGTIAISDAASCQVDVAAAFAADPTLAEHPTPRASFDCDKASTALEHAICSDISVGHADLILARVYAPLLKHAPARDRQALIHEQKQWLQGVAPRCHLSHPPFSSNELSCVRNEFESRFTALDDCENGEGFSGCLHPETDNFQPAPAATSRRASFDCEKPATPLEIAICADADLGQKDIELAELYEDAGKAMAGVQHRALIDSERRWLRFVSQSCPLGASGGIPPVFARACVRSAFEIRIGQLQGCPGKPGGERIACLNALQVAAKK